MAATSASATRREGTPAIASSVPEADSRHGRRANQSAKADSTTAGTCEGADSASANDHPRSLSSDAQGDPAQDAHLSDRASPSRRTASPLADAPSPTSSTASRVGPGEPFEQSPRLFETTLVLAPSGSHPGEAHPRPLGCRRAHLPGGRRSRRRSPWGQGPGQGLSSHPGALDPRLYLSIAGGTRGSS